MQRPAKGKPNERGRMSLFGPYVTQRMIPQMWEGFAVYGKYKPPDPPAVSESVFSFDTGGGTQHITQSIQTINKYAPPGKTNNAAFRGLAAGECLFLGASGSKRGEDDWEIAFRFAASPNVTGLTVGDITGIDKKGWEYMWVRYADAEDTAAKAIVKKPVAVYLEKVYELGDFAGLRIGT